ncbi:hypothetical protein ACFL0A_00445 [Patescibacteria group bacterium]
MEAIDIISYVNSFLTSGETQEELFLLKIVFVIFFFFFLAATIFFLLRSSYLKYLFLEDYFEFLNYRPYGVRRLDKSWNKILARLDTGTESEYKLSVIEADTILDDTLKRMGFAGESLGERFKKLTKATLPNLDLLEETHKIRNDIVHDPDYRLSLEEAKRVLKIFEQALQDLQAL